MDNQNNKWFERGKQLSLGIPTYNPDNIFGSMNWTKTIDFSEIYDVTEINSAWHDSQGNMWIGTNAGLYYYNGSSLTLYSTIEGLVHNDINSITADSLGNLWIATNGGVSKYNGQTWTNYTTADGLADNIVYSIAIDTDGNKWFATDNGLSKFSEDNITTGVFNPKNENNSNLSSFRVRIYPNPSSNYINLDGVKSGSLVQIFTMDGHLLNTLTYNGNGTDVSNLEKGMYLIKISNSDIIETKKLIKQ